VPQTWIRRHLDPCPKTWIQPHADSRAHVNSCAHVDSRPRGRAALQRRVKRPEFVGFSPGGRTQSFRAYKRA